MTPPTSPSRHRAPGQASGFGAWLKGEGGADHQRTGKNRAGQRQYITDLGFSGAVAENLMLRARLMSEIHEVLHGTTQAHAGEALRYHSAAAQ